tara:strand:- start:1105 stop:1671 length:567 start_codon:yes stop_codon:yes gene_type:complete
MVNLIKSCIFLYFSICSTVSLKPTKLPSGQERLYKFNRINPERDIKKITPMEASFISRHWLSNIIRPQNKICEEDKYIIEKINILEKLIQNQFTDNKKMGIEYLAWRPKGKTNDVLFIIITDATETTNTLELLINSPFWESRQISNNCLLDSLKTYYNTKGKKLNIENFLNSNIRYKLIWKYYNLELF